jgi:hypothetical protein
MAALPEDFRVQSLEEIDPHTLGKQPGPFDAPPREEWPTYELSGERWDLDNPPTRLPHETYRMWLSRLYAHSLFWANEDTKQQKQTPASDRPRGRPSQYPTLPGEPAAERTKRLNREAQARWRATHKPGKKATYTPELRAVYDEWVAVRDQINALTIRATELKARLDNGA